MFYDANRIGLDYCYNNLDVYWCY